MTRQISTYGKQPTHLRIYNRVKQFLTLISATTYEFTNDWVMAPETRRQRDWMRW